MRIFHRKKVKKNLSAQQHRFVWCGELWYWLQFIKFDSGQPSKKERQNHIFIYTCLIDPEIQRDFCLLSLSNTFCSDRKMFTFEGSLWCEEYRRCDDVDQWFKISSKSLNFGSIYQKLTTMPVSGKAQTLLCYFTPITAPLVVREVPRLHQTYVGSK